VKFKIVLASKKALSTGSESEMNPRRASTRNKTEKVQAIVEELFIVFFLKKSH
jgi:hypothetical protein